MTTPDDSTEPQRRGWGGPLASLVGAALLVTALIIQTTLSPVTTARGLPIPLVAPTLWRFWIPYFICVLAFGIAVDFVRVALPRRRTFTAILETLAILIGVIPLVGLLWTAQVANPRMLKLIGHPAWTISADWVDVVAALVIAAIGLWQLIELWRPRRSPQR